MSSIDPQRFLRASLRGNAAFSTISGLLFALASASVAALLGEVPASLVLGTGLQLLLFAAALAWLASRPLISLPLAWLVIAADLLWVLGTAAAVAAGVFSAEGNAAAIGVANVVLLFAVLQTIGVRKARSAQPTT